MNWLCGDLIGRGHMEWLDVELNVTGRLWRGDIPDPTAAPPPGGLPA